MKLNQVAAVILAAGKSTRLKNKKKNNKVCLKLADKPMIAHTVGNLEQLNLGQIIVVVGYAKKSVINVLKKKVDYVEQKKQQGTGHALACALSSLKPNIKYILVLYGDDSAFFPPYILRRVIKAGTKPGSAFSFMTLVKKDPQGLGRIVRDSQGKVVEIIEEKNASQEQKKIKEINLGGFCFKRSFIDEHIKKIKFDPIAKEKYLTDIVGIANKNKYPIETVRLKSENFWHGVNTDKELAFADKMMSGKS